ncbi:hypothetical protein EMCRGX_G028457 [Ephydatia muelleri]
MYARPKRSLGGVNGSTGSEEPEVTNSASSDSAGQSMKTVADLRMLINGYKKDVSEDGSLLAPDVTNGLVLYINSNLKNAKPVEIARIVAKLAPRQDVNINALCASIKRVLQTINDMKTHLDRAWEDVVCFLKLKFDLPLNESVTKKQNPHASASAPLSQEVCIPAPLGGQLIELLNCYSAESLKRHEEMLKAKHQVSVLTCYHELGVEGYREQGDHGEDPTPGTSLEGGALHLEGKSLKARYDHAGLSKLITDGYLKRLGHLQAVLKAGPKQGPTSTDASIKIQSIQLYAQMTQRKGKQGPTPKKHTTSSSGDISGALPKTAGKPTTVTCHAAMTTTDLSAGMLQLWLSGGCGDAAPEEHEGDCPRAGQPQAGEGREETTPVQPALVGPGQAKGPEEERSSLSSFDVKPQEEEGLGETTPGPLPSEEVRLEGKRKRPWERQRVCYTDEDNLSSLTYEQSSSRGNLTRVEREALVVLSNDNTIVINKTDKTNVIVIQNHDDYAKEGFNA